MPFVLDASIAAAWWLPDEQAPLADVAQDRLSADAAIVPRLFWYEVRNLLIVQERRKRLAPPETAKILADLRRLPIRYKEPDGDNVVIIARTHGLTVYDASYLELALSERVPLATLDRALAAAALEAGVELLAA